jgi:predicted metal-dependent phosphotriesterase family hydrolase
MRAVIDLAQTGLWLGKGVDDAGLRRLLVENPARAFAFA